MGGMAQGWIKGPVRATLVVALTCRVPPGAITGLYSCWPVLCRPAGSSVDTGSAVTGCGRGMRATGWPVLVLLATCAALAARGALSRKAMVRLARAITEPTIPSTM